MKVIDLRNKCDELYDLIKDKKETNFFYFVGFIDALALIKEWIEQKDEA